MATKSIEFDPLKLWLGLAFMWRLGIGIVALAAFAGVGWWVLPDLVLWFWGFIAHVWVDYAYTLAAVVAAYFIIWWGEKPGGWVQRRVFDAADNFASVMARHDAWVADRAITNPAPSPELRVEWARIDAEIARAAAANLVGKRIFCGILIAAFVLTAVLKVQAGG